MLTRAQIEARIPHAGPMCLLDRVVAWDETRIVCQAAAPTADHPLARAQGVPAVAAVEYAAQAAALHGALLDGNPEPRHGMLAKLSEVELTVGRLDDGPSALTVQAELLVRGAAGCTYSFTVHDEHGCRARGRLLVAFMHEPSARPPEGGLAPAWREGAKRQGCPNEPSARPPEGGLAPAWREGAKRQGCPDDH